MAVEEVDGIAIMKGKIRAATKKEEIRTPPIKKEINLSLVEEEDIEATFVEEDAAPKRPVLLLWEGCSCGE